MTVVTGLPNYPMGEIYEGYRNGEKRDEVLNGVKIHRCYTIRRKHGVLYRFLNYYSYAFTSTKYVARIKESFDVVFVNQLSPVMMANAGIQYKKKHGRKLLMYSLDLWPESLVAGGIRKDSVIYKYFHRVSEKIYKHADKILITSQSFSQYFNEEFGIHDTVYLPQYAETIFDLESCKKEQNDHIDLMFAGNIGTVQSVETIIQAAELTKNIQNLHWHIVGDGSEIEHLKKMAEGLENVTFHGRKPLEEMPKYYAMADAMLVTMQKDAILSLTLPGKVQTYMAAGKPIIGAIDGETRAIIDKAGCGICGEAENAQQLSDNVQRFITEKDDSYANNSRSYYNHFFAKDRFIEQLIQQLNDLNQEDCI